MRLRTLSALLATLALVSAVVVAMHRSNRASDSVGPSATHPWGPAQPIAAHLPVPTSMPPDPAAPVVPAVVPAGGPGQAEPAEETLSSADAPPAADGTVQRVRLVRRPGAIPLVRIEETLEPRPGQAPRVRMRREMVGDHALVTVGPGVTPEQVAALAATHGFIVRSRLGRSPVYLIAFPTADHTALPSAISALEGNAAFVLSVAPDSFIQLSDTPSTDPGFGDQWNLHNTGQSGGTVDADIDAPEAWDISTGSRTITVGLIDAGTQYTHPDLADNIWTNPGEAGALASNGIDDDGNGYIDDLHGWDWANGDNDPNGIGNHGTQTAGCLGAIGDNGIGVAGVCWRVSIAPLQVFPESISDPGTIAFVINAIYYAIDMDFDVLSNSWNDGFASNAALLSAIRAADAAGIIFVCSAGNDDINLDTTPKYPASYQVANIINVGATNRLDQRAAFSNYGLSVMIAAPGEAILSTTVGGGYALGSGTSYATPQVAGACALAKAHLGLSGAQIKQRLLARADSLPSLAGVIAGGRRLNIANLLANYPPSANAGADQTISLPMTGVTLGGSASDDDGTVAGYAWTQIAGAGATIASPGSADTAITGLGQGIHQFRLTVTDNQGATGVDDVQVTVSGEAGSLPPSGATAGVVAENEDDCGLGGAVAMVALVLALGLRGRECECHRRPGPP